MINDMLGGRKIILASQSPRRQHLLRQIRLDFEVRGNSVEEILDGARRPDENVIELSRQKAHEASKSLAEGIVIGFDTVVVLGKTMLGKPRDAEDAKRMLGLLSGREHLVYTGFTILEKPGERRVSDFERTMVKFRVLEHSEIERYVETGSPLDKAGAYGIQGDMGAVFVERIDGCFYNVVGLPLTKFYVSLKRFLSNSQFGEQGSHG